MALIETAIPSLINGVSQQSPHLRKTSQGEEQINAQADPVRGLRPRSPSIVTANIAPSGLDPNNIATHLINRDSDKQYKLLISDTTVKVVDLNTGVESTVTNSVPFDYLSSANSRDDLRFLTVADYTFIVNSKTTVSSYSANSTLDSKKQALFFIKKGDYSTTYNLKFKIASQTFNASYTTADPETTGANNTQNKTATSTLTICQNLFNDLETAITSSWGSPTSVFETINGYKYTRKYWYRTSFTLSMYIWDDYLVLSSDNEDLEEVEATDSLANTGAKAVFNKVQKVSDLPARALQGFKIKVDGQEVESGDEYYVEHSFSSWEETAASDEGINSTTAPHALVRQPDGSFDFQQLDWTRRAAGDSDTNPLPSFVGQTISDIFFFKDRLGFVSDENIILSEVGEQFNFFRTSMLQLLDSDPIDVSMNDDQIAQLRYAAPFDGELIVFSDNAQFTVGGEGLLSPSTISSDVTTRFEIDIGAKPKGIGRSMFFAQPYGNSGKIMEYFVDSEAQVKDAADVTAHCPHYIEGRVKWLTASTTNNMVAALTDAKEDSIYIYHFFWQGNEKVQSSWSRWEFPGFKVISCDFLENKLHIVFYHAATGSYFLEFVDISNSTLDTLGSPYLTDIRLDHLETHADNTTIDSAIMSGVSGFQIVGNDHVVYANSAATPATDVVFHTGLPLNFSYTFSQFTVPSPSRGQDVTALRGRLQLKNILLNYADSAKFNVDVAIVDRDVKTKLFDSRQVGSGDNPFNNIEAVDGEFSVPIKAEASKVQITLKNNSYLPCAFHGLEWEGWFHQRARRI